MAAFLEQNDRDAAKDVDAAESESADWMPPTVFGGGASNSAIAARAAAARGVHRAENEEESDDLDEDDDVHMIAAAGVSGPGGPLPHADTIQRSFGEHDASGISAHTDAAAAGASRDLGAKGFAQDDAVAFDGDPDLHTAAHEAAHAMQHRSGDASSDADKEKHADAVADKVVAGESAAALLQPPAGSSPPGSSSVLRKKTDDPYAWDKVLAKRLRAGKLGSSDVHDVARSLKKLTADSSPQATRLLHKMQRSAKRTHYFTRKVLSISSGVREIKAHRTGKDYGGSGRVTQRVCLEAGVFLAEVAPFAADPQLFTLQNQCNQIARFYIPVQTYGKHIERHHSYVRQLTSALDAKALLDHHMLFTLRAPDGVSMWRAGVLEPYLGNPVVGKSKALHQFISCYNDFLILDARLKALPNDGWDLTGRGLTKAQLMARKKQAAPEYVKAPGDKHDAITGSVAQRDFEDIKNRAHDLLAEPNPVPGDLYTTMQRLETIRPQVQPKWLADDTIPPLLAKLQSKFARSSDPKGTQKDSSQGVAVEVDLDDAISIGKLRTALNTIANEPGEMGQVSFKITVRASYGNAILKGFVEGWAELRLFYGVSDAMSCSMGFDAQAAIGAGLSLAGGLVEGKVEGGVGFGMQARFANPTDAATWLWLQLKKINAVADDETGGRYKPFRLMGEARKSPNMTVVKEKKSFYGGEGVVDAGVAGGSVGGEKATIDKTFKRDGKTFTGETIENQFIATAFVKVGPYLVNVKYTRTHETTEGDINPTMDEDEIIHDFSLELDLTKTIHETLIGGVPKHLPRKRIFEIVSKGLSKFGSKMPGGKIPDAIIDKLVEGVAEKLFEVIDFALKYKLGASVTVDIEFVSAKETGEEGGRHLKHTRAGVTPKFKAGLDIDAKFVEVKAELEAHKREVVYESMGTDSWIYAFQRYMFAWDKSQWHAFVAANKDDLRTLIHNMTRKRSPAYDHELAAKLKAAGYPKGSFEDHLAVVEKHWDTKRSHTVRSEHGEGHGEGHGHGEE